MTDLHIGPLRPSTAPPEEDFGPDFTNTPTNADVPKANQKNPPKPSKPLGGLGLNKKTRSAVRKLTREATNPDELSDLERLEGWYHSIASLAEPFHPKFSQAMHSQANECTVSWFGLAENNDTVRRWVLAFIEGGDWGKVIGAHTPIIMAVIPERILTQFFLRGMGLFAKKVQDESEDDLTNAVPNVFDAYGLSPK